MEQTDQNCHPASAPLKKRTRLNPALEILAAYKDQSNKIMEHYVQMMREENERREQTERAKASLIETFKKMMAMKRRLYGDKRS